MTLGGLTGGLTVGSGNYLDYLTSSAITISSSGTASANNAIYIGQYLGQQQQAPATPTPPMPISDPHVAWLRGRVDELCWHA